jgi:hypothetical protein
MSSRPTLNERIRFGNEFPDLQGLLARFIDYDNRTDEQIFAIFLGETPDGERRTIIEQGRSFLSQRELPVSLIQSRANRYFPTDEAARDWLAELLRRIESTLNVPHAA